MNDKMAFKRECFFELHELMTNKVTFVGFGGISPIISPASAPDLKSILQTFTVVVLNHCSESRTRHSITLCAALSSL